MPRKRTRAAVDKYLGGLNKDPTSASFRKLRANLGRLVQTSPTLPASKKAIEEAMGAPGTVSYLLRVQRYDHINRFLKEVERETQFPNRCAQVQRAKEERRAAAVRGVRYARGGGPALGDHTAG